MKVHTPVWRQTQISNRLGGEWIEMSPGEKDLGVLYDGKLNMSWQGVVAAQKANILGYIQICLASGSR